jgi:RNA polymerase sigma-70 factor (ECF subfamily)
MLADEVRLELVNKTRMNGKVEVGRYFSNYASVRDWLLVPGFVDRRPAILVRDPSDASGAPAYFMLLDWAGGQLIRIIDFRNARYATEGAEILMLG